MTDEQTPGPSIPAPAGAGGRLPPWQSALHGFRHVFDMYKELDTKGIKLRWTDRATAILLLVSVALNLVILFAYSNEPEFSIMWMVVSSTLSLLAVFAYIGNRFGLVRILGARETILVFQMLVGAFLLGMYFMAQASILISLVMHAL
jgi:hypothetical protein